MLTAETAASAAVVGSKIDVKETRALSVKIEPYDIKMGHLQSELKAGDEVVNLMVGGLFERILIASNATILFENKERFFKPYARIVVFYSSNASVAAMICSYDFYKILHNSDLSTLDIMKRLDRISEWKPDLIKRIKDTADYTIENNDLKNAPLIADPRELEILFDLQKNCYTSVQYRKIQSLFGDLRTSTRSETAEDTKKKLALLGTLPPAQRSNSENASLENVAGCFERIPINASIKKMLIRIIASYIISQKESPQPIMRLLLTGHDVTIQNMVVEAIAKAVNKSIFQQNIGSISSAVVLKGMASQYAGSRCGVIGEAIINFGGAANMLFNLRRIDRCSNVFSQDGATSDSVEELLNNDFFTDDWFGYPFSLHGSLFVCTAPDFQSVPKSFRDAFGNNVINFPPLDEQSQVDIFARYFKQMIKKLDLRITGMTQAAIDSILYEYTDGTVAKLEEIANQLAVAIKMSGTEYDVVDNAVIDALLHDAGGDEHMKFFRRNREKYSSEQRDEIIKLQDKLDNLEAHKNKSELLECRNTLIGLISQSDATENIDLAKARETFDDQFFGKDNLKDLLFNKIAASAYMHKPLSDTVILLYGPPGVGKTKIGELFAKSINRKFVKISLNGAFAHDIKGQSSSPGLIASGCCSCGTDAVVLLDEVDKLSLNGANALCDLLDDKQFQSNAFQSRIDFSKAVFILSANDIDEVPDFIQSRCEMVYVSGYGFDERIEIAKIFLKKYNTGNTGRVCFSNEAMDYMVERSIALERDGIRKLGQLLNNAVNSACASMYWNSLPDVPILVERRDVEMALQNLGEKPQAHKMGF